MPPYGSISCIQLDYLLQFRPIAIEAAHGSLKVARVIQRSRAIRFAVLFHLSRNGAFSPTKVSDILHICSGWPVFFPEAPHFIAAQIHEFNRYGRLAKNKIDLGEFELLVTHQKDFEKQTLHSKLRRSQPIAR